MSEFALRIGLPDDGGGGLPDHFQRVRGSCASLTAAPLWHNRQHGVYLSGNWELTNADELRTALGLAPKMDEAQLLLEGYSRLGVALFDRLRGSFALCLHDACSGKTVLARDVFGLEPLYYVRGGGALAVANSPWAARLASGQTFEPNSLAIADYIRGIMVEREATYHIGLKRLPPASTLTWAPGREPELATYWALDDERAANSADLGNHDPVQRFRELLDQSVRDAVGGCNHIGILLSGGLDSSSLFGASLAVSGEQVCIESFTKSFENIEWSDGRYLALLQELHPHPAHHISYERHNPLTHMPRLMRELDGPSHAYSLSSSFELDLLAAKHGVDVLLNGHGGDEVASYGTGRLNEFARAGQWLSLWRASGPVAAFHNRRKAQIFARYLAHVPALRGAARRYIAWTTVGEGSEKAEGGGIARAEIVALAGDKRYDYRAAYHRLDHDERALMAEAMTNPLQPHSLETLILATRAAGVKTRMPFYDRDLVEYSFALPSEHKLDIGMTRAILRRSMAGRVPERLRLRTGKFDFYPAFRNALLGDRDLLHGWTDPCDLVLGEYVRPEWLEGFWKQVDRDPGQVDLESISAIWRVATLSMWLADSNAVPRGLETIAKARG